MKTTISSGITQFVSDRECSWTCNDPLQAEKHIATWKEHSMPEGDATAIRDCADAYKKRGGTRSRRVSVSYRYENGTVAIVRDNSESAPTVAPADNPVVASLARRILESIA